MGTMRLPRGLRAWCCVPPLTQVEPTRRPSIFDLLAIASSLPNWPGTNVPLPAPPQAVGAGGGGVYGYPEDAGLGRAAMDSTGGDDAEEEGGDGWSECLLGERVGV